MSSAIRPGIALSGIPSSSKQPPARAPVVKHRQTSNVPRQNHAALWASAFGPYSVASVSDIAGGPALWGCTISYEMFEADNMVGSVRKDLMDMKVAELKDELEARGASRTARDKMALRLRLRACMLRAALDTQRAGEGGGG